MDNIADNSNDIRALVISSALPKIFTAGIDCESLNVYFSSICLLLRVGYPIVTSLGNIANFGTESARRAYYTRKFILDFQNFISAPERCHFPVIAAVHGPVIGLGFDIISACDIRYAASNSTFAIKVRFQSCYESSLSNVYITNTWM